MAWSVRFRTIDDIQRRGGRLAITCPNCGKHVLYDPRGVLEYFRSKGWNTALEVAGRHFRCGDERIAGCGWKGAYLSPAAPAVRSPMSFPEPEEVISEGGSRFGWKGSHFERLD